MRRSSEKSDRNYVLSEKKRPKSPTSRIVTERSPGRGEEERAFAIKVLAGKMPSKKGI